MRTILSIQYLRGFAALLVVAHHTREQIPLFSKYFPWTFGTAGVDIFFVISGFIMLTTTARSITSTKDFFIKRVIRVVPMYWLVTIALVALIFVAPNLFRSTKFEMGHFVKSLLFIPHESPSHPGKFVPLLVPGWTLNYEMLFYAIFAVYVSLKLNYRILAVGMTITTAVVIGLFINPTNPILVVYSSPLLLEFFFGVLLGKLYLSNYKIGQPLAFFLILASISMIIYKVDLPQIISKGIPSTLLMIGALYINLKREHKVGHLLGDASYSIYLTHLFTLGLLRYFWNKAGVMQDSFSSAALFMLTCLIFSSIIGIISHIYIEKPMTRYLRKATSTS